MSYYKKNIQHRKTGEILFLAAARINHILKNAEIRFFFVKGIFLSKILYDDINKRSGKDLDIFIHPNDRYRAIKVLKEAGLSSGNLSFDTLKKFYLPFYMDFCLFEKGISIDFHFYLLDIGKRDIRQYLRTTEYLTINSIKFPIPKDDYHLYFLIHHAKKHRFEYRTMLKDILEMYRKCEKTLLLTENERKLVYKGFKKLRKKELEPLREGSLTAYLKSFIYLCFAEQIRFIIKHVFLPMKDDDDISTKFGLFYFLLRPVKLIIGFCARRKDNLFFRVKVL